MDLAVHSRWEQLRVTVGVSKKMVIANKDSEEYDGNDNDEIPSARKRKNANGKKKVMSDIETRYAKYNACRSFPAGVYKKHINMNLIEKRAENGVIVFRPHEPLSLTISNTPTYISQILSKLHEKGNRNIVMRVPNGRAPSILIRNLPSEEELDNAVTLTAPVEIRRGPGRPYGALTVNRKKREHKDLSAGHAKAEDVSTTRRRRAAKVIKHESEEEFDLSDTEIELRNNEIGNLVDVFDINSLVQTKIKSRRTKWCVC